MKANFIENDQILLQDQVCSVSSSQEHPFLFTGSPHNNINSARISNRMSSPIPLSESSNELSIESIELVVASFKAMLSVQKGNKKTKIANANNSIILSDIDSLIKAVDIEFQSAVKEEEHLSNGFYGRLCHRNFVMKAFSSNTFMQEKEFNHNIKDILNKISLRKSKIKQNSKLKSYLKSGKSKQIKFDISIENLSSDQEVQNVQSTKSNIRRMSNNHQKPSVRIIDYPERGTLGDGKDPIKKSAISLTHGEKEEYFLDDIAKRSTSKELEPNENNKLKLPITKKRNLLPPRLTNECLSKSNQFYKSKIGDDKTKHSQRSFRKLLPPNTAKGKCYNYPTKDRKMPNNCNQVKKPVIKFKERKSTIHHTKNNSAFKNYFKCNKPNLKKTKDKCIANKCVPKASAISLLNFQSALVFKEESIDNRRYKNENSIESIDNRDHSFTCNIKGKKLSIKNSETCFTTSKSPRNELIPVSDTFLKMRRGTIQTKRSSEKDLMDTEFKTKLLSQNSLENFYPEKIKEKRQTSEERIINKYCTFKPKIKAISKLKLYLNTDVLRIDEECTIISKQNNKNFHPFTKNVPLNHNGSVGTISNSPKMKDIENLAFQRKSLCDNINMLSDSNSNSNLIGLVTSGYTARSIEKKKCTLPECESSPILCLNNTCINSESLLQQSKSNRYLANSSVTSLQAFFSKNSIPSSGKQKIPFIESNKSIKIIDASGIQSFNSPGIASPNSVRSSMINEKLFN